MRPPFVFWGWLFLCLWFSTRKSVVGFEHRKMQMAIASNVSAVIPENALCSVVLSCILTKRTNGVCLDCSNFRQTKNIRLHMCAKSSKKNRQQIAGSFGVAKPICFHFCFDWASRITRLHVPYLAFLAILHNLPWFHFTMLCQHLHILGIHDKAEDKNANKDCKHDCGRDWRRLKTRLRRMARLKTRLKARLSIGVKARLMTRLKTGLHKTSLEAARQKARKTANERQRAICKRQQTKQWNGENLNFESHTA